MGAAVERYADMPVVTSDNPRTEEPDTIIAEILTGMSPDADRVVEVMDRVLSEDYVTRTCGE